MQTIPPSKQAMCHALMTGINDRQGHRRADRPRGRYKKQVAAKAEQMESEGSAPSMGRMASFSAQGSAPSASRPKSADQVIPQPCTQTNLVHCGPTGTCLRSRSLLICNTRHMRASYEPLMYNSFRVVLEGRIALFQPLWSSAGS